VNSNLIPGGGHSSSLYEQVTPTQMFERTLALLRENFKLFFGIVLIAIGVEVVVGATLGFSNVWVFRSIGVQGQFARQLVTFPLALLGAGLIYIVGQLVNGALFYATQAKLAGNSITVGEACKLALDKVGKIIGITLLIALRALGYIFLFYLVVVGVTIIVALMLGGVSAMSGRHLLQSAGSQSIGMYVLLGAFVLVFLVAYLALLLWLVARYAISIAAGLAENLSVTEAIHRSVRISAGNKGRLYALILVAGGLWIAITLVTLPLQFMIVYAASTRHAFTPAAVGALSMCIGAFRIVLSGFFIAFMGVALPICYYDLRARTEGTAGAFPPASFTPAPAGLPPVLPAMMETPTAPPPAEQI